MDIVAIRKATTSKKRPVSVTVVALLTIFTALAFGFLQILIIGLSAVGGPQSRPSGLPPVLLFPSLVAVLVLVLSVGQLDGARWAWYGSIVFWVCCLIGSGWFAYMMNFSHGIIFLDPWGYFVRYGFIGFLLTLVPLVYAAGCIRYFFTRNVRDYFLTDSPTDK